MSGTIGPNAGRVNRGAACRNIRWRDIKWCNINWGGIGWRWRPFVLAFYVLNDLDRSEPSMRSRGSGKIRI